MKGFKDWKGEIEGIPWWKYKTILHIHYFDKGYGRLSIVKYFWLIYAGGSILEGVDYKYAMYLGLIYMLVCYLIGWYMYNRGWQSAELEVMNQINPFVRDMRKVYKPVVPK